MVIGLEFVKILEQYATTWMIVASDENLFNRSSMIVWCSVTTRGSLRSSEFVVSQSLLITVGGHVLWS